MTIHVIRDKDTGTEIMGHLIVDDVNFGCYTIERPWKDNERGISAIPKGTYNWVKVGATQKIPYEHISILNVPGRSGICIHAANYYFQIEGCIAVGSDLVDINKDGHLDAVNSRNTFTKLMGVLPDSGTILIN